MDVELADAILTGASAWMPWIDAVGYAAAGLTVATYSMKTMIPLRVTSLCASGLFLVYGYLAPSYPQLLLHAALLPLNGFRLHQMIRLIEQVREAANNESFMDWIRPFSNTLAFRKGDIVFRKGDQAEAMYFVADGRYRLEEIGVEIGPGALIGEIGLVALDNQRTQTFTCIADGELVIIGYDDVRQLYFQNPRFGFYLLNLISQRLLVNIARLEEQLEARAAPAHGDE